uniref:Kelch-like protein diablo n=1 Tax=Glossina pallidipes TaxID=7398 RepID=A0A1B0AAS7_GLOPL
MSSKTLNNGNVCELSPAYSNPNYSNVVLAALNKQRLERKRCDFTLEAEHESIYVHKVVLVAVSPYFKAMLEHNLKENAESTVKFTDVKAIALKTIVDYVYSGEINITEDTVQSLLSTSDLLQIDWVKEQCEHFLMTKIGPTNCFGIWRIADMHSCKELFAYCKAYILKHFPQLINYEEFLMLSFEEVKAIIVSDDLYVKVEEIAFQSVLNWVKHKREERTPHLRELMSHVNLSLLKPEFLRNLYRSEPLFCNGFSGMLPTNKKRFSSDTPPFKRRKTQNRYMPCVIFAGGQKEGCKISKTCKVYDISNNEMFGVSPLRERRTDLSAVSLHGLVYAMGGLPNWYDIKYLQTVERYDPVIDEWTKITPMHTGRCCFGACAHNDLVYVVGGQGNSTVENYNPITNKWYKCPDTPSRYGYGNRAAVIGNSIYSLGKTRSGILFRFDPREGQWDTVDRSDNIGKNVVEVTSYDHSLYCIGGNRPKSACKRFDARSNKWQALSSMNYGREYPYAMIIGYELYAFGGWNKECATSVEHYNIHQDEWTIDDSIKIKNCFGGAALVHRVLS